jgi:hyaluronan synthase
MKLFLLRVLKSLVKPALLAAFFVCLWWVLIYRTATFLGTSWDIWFQIYSLITAIFLISRLVVAFYYSDKHNKHPKSAYPSVSFIIACKNEEDSIAKTIDTCMKSKYPGTFNCIAVNDGSTDNTLAEMKRIQKKYSRRIRIIDFEQNRGKREAMAEGVLLSKSEVIVFVDSDSFVAPDALQHIVEHLIDDPKVGAVSGNSMVENVSTNALTKMQSARYGVSFDVFKSCESVFGAVTCCPGCFSAYRRNAIMQVIDRWRNHSFMGTRSTFGDDRSLTNFILRTWKVVYCRKAVATTIVPDKFPKFVKQQLRWKKSWIREGFNAGSFIWKKHPFASLAFYTNLVIPIFGPFILLKVIIWDALLHGHSPITFFTGVLVVSLIFGIYYYLIYQNRYWWYVIVFSIVYSFFLVWQMPYALFKLRDTRWGTR